MKKGLTLVEVMVAALIFSFISVALYTLLHTAISVRKKVESKQGTYQNINLNLDNMALRLRNVVFFKNESSGFLGSIDAGATNLEFYTQVFDYQQGHPQVKLLKYRFEENSLYKESRELFIEPPKNTTVEIIGNLESFEIVYYDSAGTETQEWEDEKQIPKGVRISLKYKDEKKQLQSMKKHIFIYRDSEVGE